MTTTMTGSGKATDEFATTSSEHQTALDRFQRQMCCIFFNHPVKCFGFGFALMLGICMLAIPEMVISEATDYDWTVTSSDESKYQDMATAILRQVDPVMSDKDDASSSTVATTIPLQSERAINTRLNLMYTSDASGSSSSNNNNKPFLFTPENLQSICEIESVLWNMPSYPSVCHTTTDVLRQMPGQAPGHNCSIPTLSVIPLFYQWSSPNVSSRECTLLSKEWIQTLEQTVFAIQPQMYFFLSSDIDLLGPVVERRTTATRSVLELGGPLQGYSSIQDREVEQKEIYSKFMAELEQGLFDLFEMKGTTFKSAYRSKALHKGIEARFFGQLMNQLEFKRVVNGDLMWTLASIVFVFVFMWIHTNSLFIATVGLLQIILSLPLAFFIYRFVFQIPYYTQLHILVIFLVLGVGADDIFVFTDAWKQGGEHAEFAQHTYYRLLYAYRRAFSAIFNTSFTTAMAFLSTAASPIMPIAAFGIYASIAIVVNYLYVIFFTPAAILVYHHYFEHRGCCGCRVKKGHVKQTTERQTMTRVQSQEINFEQLQRHQSQRLSLEHDHSSKASSSTTNHQSSISDRFFHGIYTSFITHRTVAYSIVVLFSGLILQGLVFSSQLSPPQEQEEWFTKDHMSTGILDALSRDFVAGPDSSYITGALVWGVEDLDRSEFSQWYPGQNRGTVVWTEDFNPTTDTSISLLLKACTKLRSEKCDLPGCMDGSGFLTRSVYCWPEAFTQFRQNNMPQNGTTTTTTFIEDLVAFRNLQGETLASVIGIIDKQLRFLRLPFVYTLEARQPYGITNPVNERISTLVSELNIDAPIELGPAFVTAERWFSWIRTEEGLVNGLFMGFAICFPVAFGVLLSATGNLILTGFACLSIAGIVACVLGFCQFIMGWHLGVAESISGVIVIGFSVDYVVHLGHMYEESQMESRTRRTAEAAHLMGSTVAAGAMTTLGAGVFMFNCQMVFFSKMATLITATILFSLLFALGYFMALCSLFGPEGETGSLRSIFGMTRKKNKGSEIHCESG